MSWIEEQFERRVSATRQQSTSPVEARFEELAENKWLELIMELNEDIEEYRRLGGEAGFEQLSSTQCRVTNVNAAVSATITADISAHSIRYIFEATASTTAIPEGGFFSLRRAPSGAELFSADQKITSEQARRMVLEPLLFPTSPHIV